MFVIEGADLVGKTTLAKTLWSHPYFQERGYEIQHLSRLPTGHDRLIHYVSRMNPCGIFDRFYLSELAYAEARGDVYRPFDAERLRIVHASACLQGVYTVLILFGSREVLEQRWGREEMYDLDVVWAANEAFKKKLAFTQYVDRTFVITPSKPYVDAEFIEECIDAYQKRMELILDVKT
jgi:thymidylate kinase